MTSFQSDLHNGFCRLCCCCRLYCRDVPPLSQVVISVVVMTRAPHCPCFSGLQPDLAITHRHVTRHTPHSVTPITRHSVPLVTEHRVTSSHVTEKQLASCTTQCSTHLHSPQTVTHRDAYHGVTHTPSHTTL